MTMLSLFIPAIVMFVSLLCSVALHPSRSVDPGADPHTHHGERHH